MPASGQPGWSAGLVFHENGDSAIRGVVGVGLDAEHLVGITTNLSDLIGADAILLHEAAGGVGAVGGKLPVGVLGSRGILRGIGVPFDEQMIGESFELAGKQCEQLLAVVAQACAAAFIEGGVAAFEQLDAEAFLRDGNFNLLGELFHVLAGLDLLDEAVFECVEIGGGNGCGDACALHGGAELS